MESKRISRVRRVTRRNGVINKGVTNSMPLTWNEHYIYYFGVKGISDPSTSIPKLILCP
eukprot:COSAG01_NODE_9257_length_2501_cov_3.696087_1_plen_59_part_00